MLTNLLFFSAMVLLSLIISRAGSQRQSLKPVVIRIKPTEDRILREHTR